MTIHMHDSRHIYRDCYVDIVLDFSGLGGHAPWSCTNREISILT